MEDSKLIVALKIFIYVYKFQEEGKAKKTHRIDNFISLYNSEENIFIISPKKLLQRERNRRGQNLNWLRQL